MVTGTHCQDIKKQKFLIDLTNGEYKLRFGLNFNFSPTGVIYAYSMVNVPKMSLNKEYLLLIGGKYSAGDHFSDKVHRYDGLLKSTVVDGEGKRTVVTGKWSF